MTESTAGTINWSKTVKGLLVATALLAAAILGVRASRLWLVLLFAGAGGLALVLRPQLALVGLIVAALLVRIDINTGTEVQLNAVTLLIPVMVALWFLDGARRRDLRWSASRVHRPLALFVLAGLLSLLLGNVAWDPAIPKSGNFWLVQLAQWAIFAFSALVLWLAASLGRNERWLRTSTWILLALGGGQILLSLIQSTNTLLRQYTTGILDRAPLPALLFALAVGQLLHNQTLTKTARAALLVLTASIVYYAFVAQRESLSAWAGVTAAAGVLLWTWLPRKSKSVLVLGIVLVGVVLYPVVYDYAGGDTEWSRSGLSRWALTQRVLQVAMHNPITGLGPASYRPYAAAEPLAHKRALWLVPRVNSHNNYVDVFAHTGLLGLGLLLWFLAKYGALGWQLTQSYKGRDFLAGYIHGVFSAAMSMTVLMLLADWFLPFVYNIGFHGFQASVLVWLFMGGMVSAENLITQSTEATA